MGLSEFLDRYYKPRFYDKQEEAARIADRAWDECDAQWRHKLNLAGVTIVEVPQ